MIPTLKDNWSAVRSCCLRESRVLIPYLTTSLQGVFVELTLWHWHSFSGYVDRGPSEGTKPSLKELVAACLFRNPKFGELFLWAGFELIRNLSISRSSFPFKILACQYKKKLFFKNFLKIQILLNLVFPSQWQGKKSKCSSHQSEQLFELGTILMLQIRQRFCVQMQNLR